MKKSKRQMRSSKRDGVLMKTSEGLSSQERCGHLSDSGCMQQKMAPGNHTMFFREDSKRWKGRNELKLCLLCTNEDIISEPLQPKPVYMIKKRYCRKECNNILAWCLTHYGTERATQTTDKPNSLQYNSHYTFTPVEHSFRLLSEKRNGTIGWSL
jgi:hypothetical protein